MGTTAIAFEDVQVPAENLIGAEGKGFLAIMLNFNNERLSMAVTANRMARCCLEEAIKYATKRHTFGKPCQAPGHPPQADGVRSPSAGHAFNGSEHLSAE